MTPGGELQKRYVSVMGERLLQVVWLLLEGGCRNLERGRAFVWFFGGGGREFSFCRGRRASIAIVEIFLGGGLLDAGLRDIFGREL